MTGTVVEVDHPLVRHKLGLLRDVTTPTQMFRQLVNELTLLLTYEATKALADDWWWYAIYLALAISGMIAQFLDVERRRETLRAAWSTGIGSTTSI